MRALRLLIVFAVLPLFPACGTDHYVHCKDPWCVSCRGEGHLLCPDCNGRKTNPCHECHSTGFVKQVAVDSHYNVYGGFITAVCPRCHGLGATNCPRCEGRGIAYCGRTVTLHDVDRATESRDGAPPREHDIVKSYFLSAENTAPASVGQ